MTPSDLKRLVESGPDSFFFTRDSMRFFGDTMKNYGVRAATIRTDYNGTGEHVPGGTLEVWELYRRHPVKHGLQDSAYFDKATGRRMFPR